ncbi:MAG: holin family protein [Oscillospiraceae bacterium]
MSDFVKGIMAFFCAVFGYLFGEFDGMMTALIALIVLDYITGIIAAFVERKLSSEVGARGIAKKMIMLLTVAVANVVDVSVIGEGNVLRSVAALFYIANEGISLLENGARLGVPMPKKLIDVLVQLKSEKK